MYVTTTIDFGKLCCVGIENQVLESFVDICSAFLRLIDTDSTDPTNYWFVGSVWDNYCRKINFYLLFTEVLSIVLIILAGTPATMTFSGTSRVTTAPAATIELSPIDTPCKIVALDPTHTFFPSRMGAG